MVTEKDLVRLQALYALDRNGQLSEFVLAASGELRARGIGRERDPTGIPLIAPWLRSFEQLYQPPSLPTRDEIAYALFPSDRTELVDQLLGIGRADA